MLITLIPEISDNASTKTVWEATGRHRPPEILSEESEVDKLVDKQVDEEN